MNLRYVIAINGETNEEACAAYDYTQWDILSKTEKEAYDEAVWRYGRDGDFTIFSITQELFNIVHNI